MGDELVATILLVVVGLVALRALVKVVHKAMQRSAVRKRLRGAPGVLADNTVVTLTGTVRLIDEPLIAPLSGTPCVLHLSTARVVTGRSHRYAPAIVTEHRRCEMIKFELDTRDGKVIVDGAQAEVTIRPGPVIPRKLERERAFMRAAGWELNAQRTTCEEVVIESGMKVAVNGVARFEVSAATGEVGYRDAPSAVRLVGSDDHPLTIGPA